MNNHPKEKIMTKIQIERKEDHLKVAVLNARDVLVGYAFVGTDGAGGYQINRVESWAGADNKISIRDSVLRKLSAAKFNKEISA